MKPLDLTKPLQTRDGRPAKFLHKLDSSTRKPNAVVINSGILGMEFIHYYDDQGRSDHLEFSGFDLINVPVKHVREYWVNLNVDGSCDFWSTRNLADATGHGTHGDRIACKKIIIEFEEGDGL